MNILVVDDNSSERGILVAPLAAAGCSVFEAGGGASALAMLEQEKIDAIISDILLPPMDGNRLCYEVRRSERFRSIPFILYTGTRTSPNDQQFSLELGIDRFVRKPVPAKDLLKLLRELTPLRRTGPRVPPGRKQAKDAQQNSGEQLRALTARLFTVREDESLRLARAIHDDLGHALTRLNMDLAFLEESLAQNPLPRAEIFRRTRAMSKQVEDTVRVVQHIATELRPGLLDDLGLAAALEWQAEQFATRTGIRCRWRRKPAVPGLPNKQAILVFRIFQEILNNIARHSRATTVELSCAEQRGVLSLIVHDNGKGFDEKTLAPRASLGLLGMREYTLLIGGRLEIGSEPGRGTTVTLSVPVKPMPGKTPKPAKNARGRKS